MHIRDYSLIVNLLYQVIQKKNDFMWGPEQQQAFEQIKKVTVHAVALWPVWTLQDVKNVLHTVAEKMALLEASGRKHRGELKVDL